MRPIDADTLYEEWLESGENEYVYDANAVLYSIDSAPTIDVLPADAVFTLRQALAHMWYAYVNKDSEHPHEFELEAVREAEALLGKWEDCMPIMMRRADDGKD